MRGLGIFIPSRHALQSYLILSLGSREELFLCQAVSSNLRRWRCSCDMYHFLGKKVVVAPAQELMMTSEAAEAAAAAADEEFNISIFWLMRSDALRPRSKSSFFGIQLHLKRASGAQWATKSILEISH